jgi:phasin
MTEASTTTRNKSAKSAGATNSAFEMPSFELPKFELPKFDLPKMEVPAAFRDMAEKSISQAKDNYEKMKAAAEEATDLLEDTYASATKGATDYGLKLIEAARVNTNATFDFASELMNVKSFAEMVELSTAHVRKQFEAVSAQTKDLALHVQKVVSDTAEPVRDGMTKAFRKVG